ncbi:MAG: sigma-70 family RNA polymerase sigma factor [Ginsengibacter sp.]
MKLYDEEQALITGLANHDTNAIEKIYRENYSTIQSFIVKNNGYPDDARDIFQEAMIILFEKSKSESFELTCQIKTYLYSVCRRLWLKKLQRESRYNPAIDTVLETVTVEDEIELHEKKNSDLGIMEDALSKIGEPCKSLLEAFYIQKKTMPEIAELFAYTNADNAKNQKYKCMVRLKKIFFSQYKNTNGNE